MSIPEIDFEALVMKAMSSPPYGMFAPGLADWNKKISQTPNSELGLLIPDAQEFSDYEEALAREFMRRGLDMAELRKVAKFRTTKAIIEGRL